MKKLTLSEETITQSSRTFSLYLKEVNMYQPLSPDEEYELSVKMVNGDSRAKDRIVKHNLRFVISVAKCYYTKTATLEDLVNEGNHGLVLACDNYDPSRGFRFISYAVWWIRRSIMMFLTNQDAIVRLPHHKIQVVNKIKASNAKLAQKLRKEPSLVDLLEHLKDDYLEEDIFLFYNQELIRLDKETESGSSLIDNWFDPSTPSTDSNLHNNDSETRVKFVLSYLNNQEKTVLIQLFGLNGLHPESMDSISRDMGLSKERVRQIKEKALKILRTKKEVKHIYT
jgi:RNA polymerase primary sigma factor